MKEQIVCEENRRQGYITPCVSLPVTSEIYLQCRVHCCNRFIDLVCRKVRRFTALGRVFIVSCHKCARQTPTVKNVATAGRDCIPASIYSFIVKTLIVPGPSHKYIGCKQI